MKKLMVWIGVLGLVSGSAYGACPKLEGTYVCDSNEPGDELVIEQKQVNGATVYLLTSEADLPTAEAAGELVGDGVERKSKVDAPVLGEVELKTQTTCTDKDELVVALAQTAAFAPTQSYIVEYGFTLAGPDEIHVTEVEGDGRKDLETNRTNGDVDTTVCRRK